MTGTIARTTVSVLAVITYFGVVAVDSSEEIYSIPAQSVNIQRIIEHTENSDQKTYSSNVIAIK